MMRILLTLLLFVTANTVLASASAGSLKTVLVIASDFVAADKFTQLALIGKDYSIKVEYVNAQNAGRLPNKIINNASLVILDGPRPSDRDAVEAVLSEGTAGLTVPWIQVGGGRPRFGLLPANFARSFIGYYANGTTQNYQYLFSAVEKLATGES